MISPAGDFDMIFVAANAADKRGAVLHDRAHHNADGGRSSPTEPLLVTAGKEASKDVAPMVADLHQNERALSRTEFLIALMRIAINRCVRPITTHLHVHAHTLFTAGCPHHDPSDCRPIAIAAGIAARASSRTCPSR